MLEVGSRLPEVTFSQIDNGEMKHPHTNDLFNEKKVAFFAEYDKPSSSKFEKGAFFSKCCQMLPSDITFPYFRITFP